MYAGRVTLGESGHGQQRYEGRNKQVKRRSTTVKSRVSEMKWEWSLWRANNGIIGQHQCHIIITTSSSSSSSSSSTWHRCLACRYSSVHGVCIGCHHVWPPRQHFTEMDKVSIHDLQVNPRFGWLILAQFQFTINAIISREFQLLWINIISFTTTILRENDNWKFYEIYKRAG